MSDLKNVPILLRREIEALITAPLIKAYIEEFGEEKALAVAGKVVAASARQGGLVMRELAGGNSMEHLDKVFDVFRQGGALELEVLEMGPQSAAINVTRCRYAEMYKEHGLEKFGGLLSCSRDFDLFAVFNPQIRFTRTKTIMEGCDHCDFRFELVD